MELPLRIDIATGERLPPTGIDPYTLPWVQGAASTVPLRTRMKYASQVTDLVEKRAVLKSKRPLTPDEHDRKLQALREKVRAAEERGLYGPQLRDELFKALHGQPPASDGGFGTG